MKSKLNLLACLLLTTLIVTSLAQTADDDEVNAAYPGYPHTFYSGICSYIKAILSSIHISLK